jgi:molybdenum cofactor cytidylyltransferase
MAFSFFTGIAAPRVVACDTTVRIVGMEWSMTMTISGKARQAGLVLAAGASSRMGRPKALLETPDGQRLADAQAGLLARAGCDPVAIVVGSEGRHVASHLRSRLVVQNTEWERGRFSSILAGLQAVRPFDGCLILPVDTVGVRVDTLQRLVGHAESLRPAALRPFHRDQAGYVLWISTATADALLRQQPDPQVRLDDLMARSATRLDVDDPSILNNVNTPEEWVIARESLARAPG